MRVTEFDPAGRTELFALLEAYPDAIVVHRQGAILFVNRAAVALVGAHHAAELIGRSILEFVAPESRDVVVERMQQTSSGEPTRMAADRLIPLSGVPRDVEVVSVPMDLNGERVTQLIIRDVTELRRIEAENERLAREAAEAAEAAAGAGFTAEALALAESAIGLGVWDWSVDTNELRWTRGLEPLHNMAPGTFGGTFQEFLDAVYEEDRPGLLAAINAALAEGDTFETRMRVPLGHGFRWIMGKGRVFRDAGGRATRMVGVGIDITETMNALSAAAESDNLLRLVTSLMPVTVAYIDSDERYRFAAGSYQAWYGIEAESIIGRTAGDFMGRAYETLGPALRAALAGETTEAEIDITPSTGRRNLLARFVPDRSLAGRIEGVVALFTDVTQQRLATEAMEGRIRVQGLFSALDAALQGENDPHEIARLAASVLVERFCHAVAIDRVIGGVVERLAFTAGEGVRLRSEEIPPPPHDTRAGNEAVLRSHILSPAEGDSMRSMQLLIPLEDGSAIALTTAGEHSGFEPGEQRVVREAGERLRVVFDRAALFQRLELALSARDDFLGFTTHELKTPLTVMLGFANILARRAAELPPEEVAEIAGTLLREAYRLEGIVENMLHLARAERGAEDEPTLVHRLAESVFNSRHWLAPQRPRRLEVAGNPGMVMAPSGWIDHLIENLLSNAEKYSDPEAPIDIEISGDHAFVTLLVLDRGRGITPEQAEQLFEPFFRANPSEPGVPGIGLGLTVCRRLVDRLGGEIWLRPRDGGGTVAGFRIPRVSAGD